MGYLACFTGILTEIDLPRTTAGWFAQLVYSATCQSSQPRRRQKLPLAAATIPPQALRKAASRVRKKETWRF